MNKLDTIYTGFWFPGATDFTHGNFFLNDDYRCLSNVTFLKFSLFGRYHEWGLKRYVNRNGLTYNHDKIEQLKYRFIFIDSDFDDGGVVKYKRKHQYGVEEGLMLNVYSKMDGSYVGIPPDAWYFHKREIYLLQSIDPDYNGFLDNEHRTSMVGFSIKEDKWYGWARGMYGFTTGSRCMKGDVAYKTDSVDEIYDDLLTFTPAEDMEKVEGGVRVRHKTYTFIANEDGSVDMDRSNWQYEYHTERVGRGEWMAGDRADAKIMAQDYADGCS